MLREFASMDPKASSSADAPQCYSTDPVAGKGPVCGVGSDCKVTDGERFETDDGGACLNELSGDVLLSILLYCGPTDVEEALKLVNRRFHNATSLSNTLWREFCILTGKVLDANFSGEETSTSDFESLSRSVVPEGDKETVQNESHSFQSAAGGAADSNLSRRYYFRNPCVPIDFLSINEALKHCPRTRSSTMHMLGDDTTFYSDIGTVVLMPGIYDEQICVGGELWTVGETTFDKVIAIRAAFPLSGATICSKQSDEPAETVIKDQPCISISTCDSETLEGVQKGISVRLSFLRVLHSTPGADIWGGNSGIIVEGPRAHVVVDSCILQSDSGRGMVVTSQAVSELYRSSIIDCAATGFYVGDWGSRARVSGCNIIRNGFGSRRLRSPSANDVEAENMLDRIAAHTRMLERGLPVQREDFGAVPPGHSGVYVESSLCWIDNSVLAGNSLTGLSVVRGGFVSLSGSSVAQNGGHLPILIEDAHDIHDPTRLNGISIRGGVVEGPESNNYSSFQLRVIPGQNLPVE